MSIFKESFKKEIRAQLEARQAAIEKRDATAITYFNARTAFVKMTSGVDIDGDEGSLAKNNILFGGIFNNSTLKSGVGDDISNAYSFKSYSSLEKEYRLGIRPMPGITGVDIKTKSAYGSLMEATVNFTCWDIKQLEDLELLYMRPNYSVLLEWGWAPYLAGTKDAYSIGSTVNFNTTVLSGGATKEAIWKDLYNKSLESGGNYNALYGFVKNYSWSARPDGGYDCSTTLITMGEIIESLKVNWVPSTTKLAFKQGTFNKANTDNFKKDGPLNKAYQRSYLAGLLYEMYIIMKDEEKIGSKEYKVSANIKTKEGTGCSFYCYKFETEGQESSTGDGKAKSETFVSEPKNIYIKLKDFISLLNSNNILHGGVEGSESPIVEVSLTEGFQHAVPGADLLCLGHPYQISMDPTICLINNPQFSGAVSITGAITEDNVETTQASIEAGNTANEVIEGFAKANQPEFLKLSGESGYFGIIGEIYVNLAYLYTLITDDGLASQDKNEKKDINLFDFLKNMMSGVNNSIGNVANFDIHVDPTDSIARIIDVNYVDEMNKAEAYKNTFELQMHNLKSTVRSYKLESQIFPEQSSVVAIGAQAKGGALGSGDNTLIDFNQNLEDRIVKTKNLPPAVQSSTSTDDTKLENLKTNLEAIAEYFSSLDDGNSITRVFGGGAEFDKSKSSQYTNALKDIISYTKTLTADSTNNRAIIPTKLSIEMDGIGGIIIGSMFKIPEDLLPRGYTGKEVGARIGYLVTSVAHSIGSDNDWKTSLGAQFIILDGDGAPSKSKSLTSIADAIKKEAIKVERAKKIEQNKESSTSTTPATNPPSSPVKRSEGTCKSSYQIITQQVAPGINVPPVTKWENIKKSYPIITGGVPILAIGTPYDSGNDFHYKMKSAKVSKRTKSSNYIVLHYTVSEFTDPTSHYKGTWEKREASSDFVIGRSGRIAGFKSYKTYKSWHYGEATWPDGIGFNNESIGFEIESTGWAYYCATNKKFYTNGNKELNINEVALTNTYRGHNIWHYHTDVQISAIANLIIALYNDGAINDKTTFLANCTGNNRYNTLFPATSGLTTKPSPGVITHGTGRNPSGKIDTFPQNNLLAMLDDLPTLIKSNPKTYINWTK